MIATPGPKKQDYVPARGEVVWLSFDPQAGHEQSGRRPALVLSPGDYARRSGLSIDLPRDIAAKGLSL